MSRIDMVEEYLVRNLDYLDMIAEQVTSMLPDSYFYKQELKSKHYETLRLEIQSYHRMISSRIYRYDNRFRRRYKNLVETYEADLKKVADKNRSEFHDWLLGQDIEIQCVALMNLISSFNLLKYLRTYNND